MAIDENGKVTFTPEEQAEVDRVVGERLGRERQKYEGLEDLRELPDILKDFGYTGTPAEIKQAVRAHAQEYKKQAELEQLQAEAARNGTSPELAAEIKALKAEVSELKQYKESVTKEFSDKQKADQDWVKQVDAFTKKHPTIDLEKLSENQKFLRFVKGKNLPLIDLYEDFVDLLGGAEAEAIAKLQSNVDRSTSSGRQKGSAEGGTHGLTPRQIALVDDYNRGNPDKKMSYKEYATTYGHIKK